MRAAPTLEMLVAAVIIIITGFVTNKFVSTFSTSQNGSENINLARWSRTHVACQKCLHTVKLLSVYDCRAELVIISAAPVIHASVQLFFQHTPKRGVTPVHAVCFPDITDSSPLGNCVFKIIKSVLHNGCVFPVRLPAAFFSLAR